MKKCNDCVFNAISLKHEPDPDKGIIQKRICSSCGDSHKFFLRIDTEQIPPEIAKLAKFFQTHLPHEIKEGSAVDNAIRLLQKPW